MAFENGYALSIGIGSYQHVPQANIPISVADAKAVSDLLCNQDLCGYLPEHVNLLRNAETSRAGILKALDELAGKTTPENTVLLYYCGHGEYGQDGNYYLTTYDTQVADGKIATGTGISNAELLEKLRAIPAKRLLLLFNACHSGELSPHLGLGDAEKSFGGVSLPQPTVEALLSTGEGRIIITASRPDQKSWIGSGKLSIFTQALVNGLSGQGYVPNNRGYVSAYGLYEHLYFAVKETAEEQGHTQEPELTVLKGVGPFPVSLYRGAASLGMFDPEESLPEGTAARAVDPARSERLFKQIIKTVTASGERAVAVGGNVQGPIITGDQNRVIDTGGGAYVEGQVRTGGGDFVGRDKITNDHSRSTMFDQRGQRVRTQYNIAGDFNFGAAQTRQDVVAELRKLQTELQRAVEAQVLPEEKGTDAKYQLDKAVLQAQKPTPDKNIVLDHLGQAKQIIAGVAENVAAMAGLATAVGQAIQMIQKLF